MTPELEMVLRLESDVAAGRCARGQALNTVRAELGLSESRYYQVLLTALESAEALEAYPALVNRLSRLRAQRQEARRKRLE